MAVLYENQTLFRCIIPLSLLVQDSGILLYQYTYHATKNPNKVRIITYVDGPFFADMSLDEPSAKKKLRDQIYHQMEERAKTSDKEMIHYVFKGESI